MALRKTLPVLRRRRKRYKKEHCMMKLEGCMQLSIRYKKEKGPCKNMMAAYIPLQLACCKTALVSYMMASVVCKMMQESYMIELAHCMRENYMTKKVYCKMEKVGYKMERVDFHKCLLLHMMEMVSFLAYCMRVLEHCKMVFSLAFCMRVLVHCKMVSSLAFCMTELVRCMKEDSVMEKNRRNYC